MTGGGSKLFIAHTLTMFAVIIGVALTSFLLYKITDMVSPLRVTEDQELEGLDLSQHGETATTEAVTTSGGRVSIVHNLGAKRAA